VSEQFLNSTSAQLGYPVPVTLVIVKKDIIVRLYGIL